VLRIGPQLHQHVSNDLYALITATLTWRRKTIGLCQTLG